MDDQLLLKVYHWLFDSRNFRQASRCSYSDSVVVLIYQFGVIRQRSPFWAWDKTNWPLWMRRLKRPSYSQLMRRLKTSAVLALIERMNQQFHASLGDGVEKFCDGKPLTVGGYSKDPDSGEGKLPDDGWGRGYKLHVLVDADSGAIDRFAVTKLSGGEPTVMRRLLGADATDPAHRLNLDGKLLRADSNYDSNALYRDTARCGGRLLANRKKPFTGLGHRVHHPDRFRAIKELESDALAMREHRRRRAGVERALGHLTNLPFGLCPLPNFVRRQRRVYLWVLSKIMLYHLHLTLTRSKSQLQAA